MNIGQVRAFYDAWSKAVGPEAAAAARDWHVPLRHAMWLWSVTWCCKWKALSHEAPQQPEAGEDWSVGNSDASLVAHVRERVNHYLSPGAIALVLEELRDLRVTIGQ